MAASRGSFEQNPAPSLGQHTISTHSSTLQTSVNSNRPITPFMLTDESIGDAFSVWTLFLMQASMLQLWDHSYQWD